ncbi:MAG: M20/M25/M40 family metallo-hydrolase [Acidobacteria bacterium]|nr:MAG: M20/M25/M40 family metallo-hydrolase [Acidobacteriota bacterium]
MSGPVRLAVAAALLASVEALPAEMGAPVHHELTVRIDPAAHRLEVEDEISLPEPLAASGDLRFLLHRGLEAVSATPEYAVERMEPPRSLRRYGINEESPGEAAVPLDEYRLRPTTAGAPPARPPILRYSGVIHHPIRAEGEEYARSFSRTPGLIDEKGVVLSGSTFWVPLFGDALVSFRMTVDLPAGWDAVSQGRREKHEAAGGRRRVVWNSPEPMDEIYLVAAPFEEYERRNGKLTAMVFLREKDPNLAARYLEATVQDISMYEKLIGPYPYAKFALVENFWETGYGMPSFTLLGPKIIRFPFILQSSYPHEILHNWWGNSVFVDYESGNWCEGLTAYLADHLFKEMQGAGEAYRRDTLERYRSYVREARDFPLTEFRSRHSSATEAVGYGKSLMLWHMLRRKLGDATFVDALARLYRDYRFRRASFADIEKVFSAVSGTDLGPFFRQWVERTGAPSLALGRVADETLPDGRHLLTVELRQVQREEPFAVEVPVAITVAGESAARIVSIEMSGRTATGRFELPGPPVRVDVDPQFDLFRRLDPREIPPTLSRLFGAPKVAIVVPDGDGAVPSAAWRRFAEGWARGNAHDVRIVGEAELDRIPRDRAVWILGEENRWARAVTDALAPKGVRVDRESVDFGSHQAARPGTSFVLAAEHPYDEDLALGWIAADNPAALPGLARKLPHYGRYSYLAFEGDEPTNVLKGRWEPAGSPLVHAFAPGPRAALPQRQPLARPEPVFDASRMMEDVRWLASPELEGRSAGSEGLRRAAERVARVFAEAGLAPGGEDGYFQIWEEPGGPEGRTVTLRNVVGVIPGTRPDWRGQSVVLGAHLDHLGRGWPDVHAGDEGRIHPGADDNASGVAVLLELARILGRSLHPPRAVVFVAFDGEEWGRRGSRHYVETMRDYPARDAIAMINLDTVGRPDGGRLMLFGTGTAEEWPHIAMGVGFTTGVQVRAVPDDPGGSDQMSFVEAGVPAVQLFGSAHEDYHRPTDTPDKVRPDALVDAATFVREAAVYLAERTEPLTAAGGKRPGAGGAGRKVSLGTLPDFTDPGPGVLVVRVMPDSPAERAGLRAGDRIVAIDGQAVADVRAYAEVLRGHAPGDTIRIEIERGGERLELDATLAPR